MCVIAMLPKHIALSHKILKNCYERNPDGFGIMAVIDGKMEVAKSMGNFNDFLTEFRQFPQNVQRAVHFRWATHGTLEEKNCHPFPVTPDLYMMHNGVISTCEVDTSFSDTWNFATHDLGRPEIMDAWGPDAIARQDFREMVEKISADSKLLFMDGQGRSMMTFEKDWHQERGCWFSNKHSLEEKYKPYRYGSYGGWHDNESSWGSCYDPKRKDSVNLDFLGKVAAEATQHSDLVPYGRTIDGTDAQDCQPDNPGVPGEDFMPTVSDLYDMSEENISDWVQDDPWGATDLILTLIGRDSIVPIFDKKAN